MHGIYQKCIKLKFMSFLKLQSATIVNKRIDEYHDYEEEIETQVFKPVGSTVDVRVACLAIL